MVLGMGASGRRVVEERERSKWGEGCEVRVESGKRLSAIRKPSWKNENRKAKTGKRRRREVARKWQREEV
jgi:hypothetical protein